MTTDRGRIASGSFLRAVSQAPSRMLLTKLDDPPVGDEVRTEFEVQFNPTEFAETIEVEWAKRRVVGLSHQPLQYVGTGNYETSLELYFDADSDEQATRNLVARKFLLSLCYPIRTKEVFVGGAPPRVLFLWPTIVALTAVVRRLQFANRRFAPNGFPVEFTATLQLEEIRDLRLLTDDLLTDGTIRGPDSDPFAGL